MKRFAAIDPKTNYVCDEWIKTCEERGWEWPIIYIGHRCGHTQSYLVGLRLPSRKKEFANLAKQKCPKCKGCNSRDDWDGYQEWSIKMAIQRHLDWIYDDRPVRKLSPAEEKAWNIPF